MGIIRSILRFVILAWDRLTPPKPLEREASRQEEVEAETRGYSLYQLEACPFCVKVRREMRRLNLPIALKDVKDPAIARELLEGGKKDQVPCLRVDGPRGTSWIYESGEINRRLRERFAIG